MERIIKLAAWWENLKAKLREESGQGMVEYGLILAVVALVAVVGLTSLGSSLSDRFNSIVSSLTK